MPFHHPPMLARTVPSLPSMKSGNRQGIGMIYMVAQLSRWSRRDPCKSRKKILMTTRGLTNETSVASNGASVASSQASASKQFFFFFFFSSMGYYDNSSLAPISASMSGHSSFPQIRVSMTFTSPGPQTPPVLVQLLSQTALAVRYVSALWNWAARPNRLESRSRSIISGFLTLIDS